MSIPITAHNAMGKAGRDITFDIMKGIGILLVLAGHVWGGYIPITNHFIRSFHMPLFFIVAGYFSKTYNGTDDFGKTMANYFRRLAIPMLATELTITIWSALMALVHGGEWNTVIVNALSMVWADVYGPNTPWGHITLGVIWFLMALMIAKALLWWVARMGAWALPVSLVVSFGAVMANRVFPYSIWCITLGMSALPFVVVGWWARSHPIHGWMKITGIVCWILSLLFSELDMYSFRWACYPLDFAGACGATYCVYRISRWIGCHTKVVRKVLAWLGVASMAIMCVHGFEIESHLGNHLRALMGLDLSIGGLYVWRYLWTIAIAAALLHLPGAKKIIS